MTRPTRLSPLRLVRLGAIAAAAALASIGFSGSARTPAVAGAPVDTVQILAEAARLATPLTMAGVESEGEVAPARGDGGLTQRAEQYRYGVRAFALDIYGTGHLESDRAKELAGVAVSEAMKRGLPPALVLGVMRVENTTFKSRASSFVGAKGLMQVMPRIWLPVYGHIYGRDLENDTTNIRTGVAVLAENVRASNGDWRRALLRYNGCVRGTNTPDCHRYPDKVRRAIERDARWSCWGLPFERCVVEPVAARFSPAARMASTGSRSNGD